MPYFSGTATSASDLITAINNAATANGWTLSATGNVLSKGNVFAQLSQWNPNDDTITAKGVGVQAGLGESSGVLTSPCNNICGMVADMIANDAMFKTVPLSYPLTYHIFINVNPDEIVVAANYNSLYWQWLAFGQASKIGITGTGIYCWGTACKYYNRYGQMYGFNVKEQSTRYNQNPCFWGYQQSSYSLTNEATSHIHLSLDATAWFSNSIDGDKKANVYDSVGDILRKQPNEWNNESILARTQILAQRADAYWSYVAELPHFRYVRNKFFDDGEVITLGTDNWFVAPIFKKDLEHPDGSYLSYYNTDGNVSGTNGFAVRKTA